MRAGWCEWAEATFILPASALLFPSDMLTECCADLDETQQLVRDYGARVLLEQVPHRLFQQAFLGPRHRFRGAAQHHDVVRLQDQIRHHLDAVFAAPHGRHLRAEIRQFKHHQ